MKNVKKLIAEFNSLSLEEQKEFDRGTGRMPKPVVKKSTPADPIKMVMDSVRYGENRPFLLSDKFKA